MELRRLPDTDLFLIGLSTPASTVLQIVLCLGYFALLKKKRDPMIG